MSTLSERVQALSARKNTKKEVFDDRYGTFINELADYIVRELEKSDNLENVHIFIPQGSISRFLNNSFIKGNSIINDLNKIFDNKIVVNNLRIGTWCEVSVTVL